MIQAERIIFKAFVVLGNWIDESMNRGHQRKFLPGAPQVLSANLKLISYNFGLLHPLRELYTSSNK
jgi:hypothetical protein